MRFFFHTSTGDGLFLAARLEAEGNEVQVFFADPHVKSPGRPGQGLLRTILYGPGPRDSTAFIRSRIDRDTTVVFDMVSSRKVKTGPVADRLRRAGYAVIGAGGFQDAIELNRSYGAQVMASVGIPIPATVTFKDFDEAASYVETHPTFLVFKPHGNVDAEKSIVADDAEHMTAQLAVLKATWKGPVEFELQERIEGGLPEVSLEGWFNGRDFIDHSLNSTVEEKRFLTGGLGPQTGCMGSVVWFWRRARPKLFTATLGKLVPILRQVDYRGPIDLNTRGGRGLEFTARLGYSALQAMLPLLKDDIGQILSDTARGQARSFAVTESFGGAVNLSIPPFPHEHEAEQTFGTLITVPPSVEPWFMIGDVQLDGDRLIASGQDGAIGVMTATHPKLDGLERLLYQRVAAVRAQDLQYRTDILSYRARREIPMLLAEAG